MKRLSITALAVAAVGFSGIALADDPVVDVFSPESGEVIYKNALILSGADTSAVDEFEQWNSARWALRQGTCAASTGTVAGNVDGYNDTYTWEGGYFAAELDAAGFSAGEYCFVLNTQQGNAAGNRQAQVFYIVDEYAKVGGRIYLPDEYGVAPPGNSPTDTVEGVVGRAGAAGVVGSITVNYREVGTYVTYEAESLKFSSAPGIEVNDPMARAEVKAEDGAIILILDRNASIDFPRGALVVRSKGSPTDNEFEIDSTPGSSGGASWVPMERGNNETGKR